MKPIQKIIVAAIGDGNRRVSEIFAVTNVDQKTINNNLTHLLEIGEVQRIPGTAREGYSYYLYNEEMPTV